MKIIHVGVNKTGTVSLHEALKILGYESAHWKYPDSKNHLIRKLIDDNIKVNRKLFDGIENYDAYLDFQCNMKIIKIIDKQYPGSKFIFTERNIQDWVESRTKHIKKHKYIKGDKYSKWKLKNTLEWEMEFNKYKSNVVNYFKNRNSDLLIMNICDRDDQWEQLCNFLGHDIPDVPFPKKNVTGGNNNVK
ncbi:MAG: sulfotransferase family protein [Candidatus Lokiarchaeota archaeon]|nr:sulfotransferase family protein [Candidatus Lokiarchaeota archaeon]MBD3199582.1 sulfotransferase family protein [Candidatus Lokiarchaeota archaeon]